MSAGAGSSCEKRPPWRLRAPQGRQGLLDGVAAAMTWPGVLAAVVAVLRRWLERLHPGALAGLDHGGPVHPFSDATLRAGEPAAEIGAAVDGVTRGHYEVATVCTSAFTFGDWRSASLGRSTD